jgi:hypothetical protein
MARPPRTQPKFRLNLEMPEATKESLDRLKDATQADSTTEVIRRALAVYDFLWSCKKSGETPIVRSQDGKERELLLL